MPTSVGVQPGDVVAVWGAGAVGQMAARAAMLLGSERVVVIDRYGYRLDQVERHVGAETLNYERDDVGAELLIRDVTGSRAEPSGRSCDALRTRDHDS